MTPKQQRFVDEYVVLRHARQAAIGAGYPARTAAAMGCKLLRKPHIQAAIAARSRGEPFPETPPRQRAGINLRQQRFAEEYLVVLNAREAAVRAGYSARSAAVMGCQLLKHPEVAKAIREGMAARSARTAITGDQVVAAFAQIATFDLARLMDWGPDGVTVKPSAALAAEDRAAITELSLQVDKNGVTRLRVRLQDKQRALDSLAKHFMLYSRSAAPMLRPQPSPEELRGAREKLRQKLLNLARGRLSVEEYAAGEAKPNADATGQDEKPAGETTPEKAKSEG